MSTVRTRIGALAAGVCCLLAVYAVAQQTQTREDASDRASSSQFDRSDSQQADQSATRESDRASRQFGRAERDQATQFNQRRAQVRAGGQSDEVQHFLASCLLSKNEGEIELNRFAQQQSKNQQVKQFAQQMIQDHEQLSQQLQPLAGGQADAASRTTDSQSLDGTTRRDTERQASDTTRLPGSSGASQTARTATDEPGALTDTSLQGTRTRQNLTATTSEGGSGVIQQLIQIERQITERQGQQVKEELQQKQGPEFDKCYLGTVIHAHINMLAALETIEQQQQGQLAQVAQEARPVVQQHLEHAKQLIQQVEQQGPRAGGQAERQQQPRTQRQ